MSYLPYGRRHQAPGAAAEQAPSRPVRITKPPISRKPRSPKSELSVSSEQKDRRRLSAQRAAASLKKRPKEQDQ